MGNFQYPNAALFDFVGSIFLPYYHPRTQAGPTSCYAFVFNFLDFKFPSHFRYIKIKILPTRIFLFLKLELVENHNIFNSRCEFDKGKKIMEAIKSHREMLKKKVLCVSNQKSKVMSKYLDLSVKLGFLRKRPRHMEQS